MRLHRVTATAFGPFADRQSVDLDALSDAGLFLLSGPTGAGKTSLLDAVVYALYGVVPGARQGAARPRSDHAAADVATEVSLEATVRGRRMRVTRRPAWDRPKRRGDGMTREPARVVLEEETPGGWVVLSTRLDEAGQLLRDLLGMSAEQFCQVVLLPQGEFARFLRADAESRRGILEALFSTDRFSAVEAWLAEQRKATRERAQAAAVELDRLSDRATQAARGLVRPADDAGAAGLGAEAPLDADAAALRVVRDLAAAALDAADGAEAAAAQAQARCAAARQGLHDAQEQGRLRRAAVDLAARSARLEQARADRDAAERRVVRAQRAAAVLPWLDASEAAARAAAAATRAEEAARARLPEALAPAEGEQLRAAQAAAARECAVLEALEEDEQAAAAAVRRAAAADAERSAISTRRAEVAALLAAHPGRSRELTLLHDEAREAGHVAARLEARIVELDARAAAAGQARRLEAAAQTAADAVRAAVDAAQEARDRWLDARQRRLDGMAAELAAGLTPDAPCPVCGSADHPHPAPPPEHESQHDEEAAAQRAEAADGERRRREQGLHDLRVELASAQASAGGAALEELQAELARSRAELAAASRRSAQLEPLQGRIDALAQEAEALGAEDQGLAERAEELALVVRAATAQAEAIGKKVETARGNDASVRARRLRLESLSSAAEAAAEVVATRARAVSDAAAAAEQADAAAVGQGFADAAQAREATLPKAELSALERRVTAHDAEAAVVADKLAEAEFADGRLEELLAQPAPDEQAARAAADAADAAGAAALADRQRARERSVDLEQIAVEVEQAVERLAPLRAQAELAHAVSTLCEGTSPENSLRMRLSAYVLAARLEQVAEAATERLQRMSAGRYSLVHTDAAGSRGRSGLGLSVLDAWTGVARDPATLSGGEAFTASLALALGLADVVTGEAGGVLMETLFVDEGFGSLDDETLDEVLDVLDGLREGGRVVGLVSHVSELRARIPAQVLVGKGRHGSTLRLSDAALACGAARPVENGPDTAVGRAVDAA